MSPVVHEKQLKLLHVVDQELVETVRQQVTGALVGSCTGGDKNGKYRRTEDEC